MASELVSLLILSFLIMIEYTLVFMSLSYKIINKYEAEGV